MKKCHHGHGHIRCSWPLNAYMHICVCARVCVFKSIQIQPGWRRPSQAEEKPWREWISHESVRLIWPAQGEIQQLCLDMMNCMCRTRVFTEQTTESRGVQERNPALSHKHLVKERNHKRASVLQSISSGGLTRTTPQRELKMSGKRGRARERTREKKRGKVGEMHW